MQSFSLNQISLCQHGFQVAIHRPNRICTFRKKLFFCRIELDRNNFFKSVFTNNTRNADADIVLSVFAFQHHRAGNHFTLIVQNAVDQVSH